MARLHGVLHGRGVDYWRLYYCELGSPVPISAEFTRMTRWKFTIEYDGTDFCGWQFQEDVPTIQAIIENAIKAFSQQDTRLHVAGRTDAGVHACGQVAHADFETSRPMTGHEVKKAINAHLRPHRICILKAEPMTDDFHDASALKIKCIATASSTAQPF